MELWNYQVRININSRGLNVKVIVTLLLPALYPYINATTLESEVLIDLDSTIQGFNKCIVHAGACGQVDEHWTQDQKVWGSIPSAAWPCVELLGKLCIPHCLGPPSRNGYLVHRSKVGLRVAGCCAPTGKV